MMMTTESGVTNSDTQIERSIPKATLIDCTLDVKLFKLHLFKDVDFNQKIVQYVTSIIRNRLNIEINAKYLIVNFRYLIANFSKHVGIG